MRILALDTSADACSVALWLDGQVLERHKLAPRQQTALILPFIEELLTEAGVQLSALDAVAFGRGPGTFTGVRITTSVAQGLAFGADLPLVPISTLQALAQCAYHELAAENVLAALDARMGEIYWCVFQLANHGLMEFRTEEKLSTVECMIFSAEAPCYGVGSGCEVYQNELIEQSVIVKHGFSPRARDIAELAVMAYQQGHRVTPEEAVPIYLRDAVVTPKE